MVGTPADAFASTAFAHPAQLALSFETPRKCAAPQDDDSP